MYITDMRAQNIAQKQKLMCKMYEINKQNMYDPTIIHTP